MLPVADKHGEKDSYYQIDRQTDMRTNMKNGEQEYLETYTNARQAYTQREANIHSDTLKRETADSTGKGTRTHTQRNMQRQVGREPAGHTEGLKGREV